MTTLPIGLSLPHAGLDVPQEVVALSTLSHDDIQKDSDEGSREMAMVLRPFMADFIETTQARAFIDLNREEGDISRDGVVKTHTSWDTPIYTGSLPSPIIEQLIATYHRPYHTQLNRFARQPHIRLAIDLHTMSEFAPPIASDVGARRPRLCLGNNHHTTAPQAWIETLAELMAHHLDPDVEINTPFSGGWITRCHGRDMPWIQIEVSREPWISSQEKGEAILEVMRRFAETMAI